MDIEGIKLSEMSDREKYSMISFICIESKNIEVIETDSRMEYFSLSDISLSLIPSMSIHVVA